MLLGERGIRVGQEDIAASAGLATTIEATGSRVDQLADAVERLVPTHRLVARFHSTTDDLRHYLAVFQRPLGIEWQGRFRRDDGSQFDEGHYSVIVGYHGGHQRFNLVDPDPRSLYASGTIASRDLATRWWESNSVDGGTLSQVTNRGLLFLVAATDEFPIVNQNGFERPTVETIRRNGVGEH